MRSLLPPSENRDGTKHLLQPADGFQSTFLWQGGLWRDEFHPDAGGATPEAMAEMGFVYIGPAVPTLKPST